VFQPLTERALTAQETMKAFTPITRVNCPENTYQGQVYYTLHQLDCLIGKTPFFVILTQTKAQNAREKQLGLTAKMAECTHLMMESTAAGVPIPAVLRDGVQATFVSEMAEAEANATPATFVVACDAVGRPLVAEQEYLVSIVGVASVPVGLAAMQSYMGGDE
jgi:hypothetical protein